MFDIYIYEINLKEGAMENVTRELRQRFFKFFSISFFNFNTHEPVLLVRHYIS